MQPKPIAETLRPERPRVRVFMQAFLPKKQNLGIRNLKTLYRCNRSGEGSGFRHKVPHELASLPLGLASLRRGSFDSPNYHGSTADLVCTEV
jgi:hypothetical protein